ncbi:cell division protein FtsK [Candidatus Peregrinibacteria bacterium CG10_big_fil_rev_8_21_14_0_10_36_19]|nr:MAG: cell division protein FtsK [Candidatus Peregrinibacteria bacterium CG10_big_fil_rev_8_21_14_0_10_36_19]
MVKKRSLKRRRTTVKRTRKTLNIKVKSSVAREIWAVIYMAIGILTVLSLQGAFGIIGDAWVSMLKPVVGWGVFIVPGVFVLVSTMMFFSKNVQFGPSRTLGLMIFLASVLSLLHLSVPIDKIHEYAALGRYGGYVGFVTNFLFLEVLKIGQVGASIIFSSAFLVSLLLIFEVSVRDIARFIIPQIKIEMVKDAAVKDRERGKLTKEKSEDNFEVPEIFIHKAKINTGVEKSISDANDNLNTLSKSEGAQKPLMVNMGDDVASELSENVSKVAEADYEWEFPSLDLLKNGDSNVKVDEKLLMDNAEKIQQKLLQFGIDVVMHEVNVGPTVVQYTLKPDEGVKLSKITSLKNDLALALAAERVRIEAPIPGKSLVGIEVPNGYRTIVYLREMLESAEFTDAQSKLTFPLGRDVTGRPIVANLEAMPHLLIAGATGSGKSVAMNTFLMALLYQNSPKELKFIMIDPKRVELSTYNNIPHLLAPVITDPEKAAISLRWVVAEMTRRYTELSEKRVRNIFEYNDLPDVDKLAKIVVVIDELADLMMVSGKEVEASICRIAQMARAVGIHLVIATQRPSVDVITGLIKANIPSRIAFAVSTSIDSRTILDGVGAEDLVGRGDMLYLPTGKNKPVRVQGIYVSTEEIEKVTNRVKLTIEPDYDESITSSAVANKSLVGIPDAANGNDEDDLYEAAYQLVCESRKASASLLQRRLKVGYARAARLIDLLEENGVVGPADGAKPRQILVD